MTDLICDVCKVQPALGVASMSCLPMSIAFCVGCARQPAEPEWAFEYLYSVVGTKGAGLADWISNYHTWKDGRYWSWDEWKTWRQLPAQAHFDDEHEEWMQQLDGDTNA